MGMARVEGLEGVCVCGKISGTVPRGRALGRVGMGVFGGSQVLSTWEVPAQESDPLRSWVHALSLWLL